MNDEGPNRHRHRVERRPGGSRPGFGDLGRRQRMLAQKLVVSRAALGSSQAGVVAWVGTSTWAVARLSSPVRCSAFLEMVLDPPVDG